MKLLKERLRRGDVAVMVDPNHPSPGLVEDLGRLGFDAVFIDCEHGAAGHERVEDMARAARAAGIASVLRPEITVPHLMVRYLDRGIDGLMLSGIHDADAALEAVETIKSARAEAGDFAAKLIVVEVGSLEAIVNIPQIAAIEEIDVLFVGSGSLAKAVGLAGRRYDPKVIEVCLQAIGEVRRAGKACGSLAARYEDVDYLLEAGVQYLYAFMRPLLAVGAERYRDLVAKGRRPQ